MEESDGPYFQKLREISHSNLHAWKDKELINSQQKRHIYRTKNLNIFIYDRQAQHS